MNNNELVSSAVCEESTSMELYLIVKRLFDILVSFVSLIILSPLFLIVIIAIKIEDKGKAILVQDRIGQNGKIFKLYKFRSMVKNADEILLEILAKDDDIAKEYKANKKIVNDPRITKVGKIIRKLSIDELPQLVNIFKGDMSFIGNRPYLPREMNDMQPYYENIVRTKPGLTGLWQVNGRSDLSFKKRLKIESEYSDNMNLILDIKIFFKTFLVVFKGL